MLTFLNEGPNVEESKMTGTYSKLFLIKDQNLNEPILLFLIKYQNLNEPILQRRKVLLTHLRVSYILR